MIIYMPFTYLSDGLIHQIHAGLGPFGVCQLGDMFQPSHLANWIQRRIIRIHKCQGVEENHLSKTLKAFLEWGHMHESHLSAMAGYYATSQQKSPLTDDTNPTKISNLIRQYGGKPDEVVPDRQFQAALFLAMAQAHDEQQASVDGSMSRIQKMEQEMISQLSGELPDGLDEPQPLKDSDARYSGMGRFSEQDVGQSYTNERIDAWAMMALGIDDPADLYFTTSDAVFDALLERLTDAHSLGRWRLPLMPAKGSVDGSGDAVSHILNSVATAKDPVAEFAEAGQVDFADDSKGVSSSVEIYSVTGRTPGEVFEFLSNSEVESPRSQSAIRNTLIGRLTLSGNM